MIGIYGIHNLITNKWYIGQSIDIESRWKHHLWGLNNKYHYNNKLQRSWNLHGGDSFEFVIIEECIKEKLDELEKYWIKYYDSLNNGYNLCEGGNTCTGRVVPDHLKEAMSIARTGEGNPFYGKHHSEEWKMSNSERNLGDKNYMYGKYGKEHHRSKKVRCIETNIIYDGLAEAGRQTNTNRNNISSCCHGRLKTAGGYHWEYVV